MRLCVPVTAFVQNCRPRGSDVNTKGSDTGWSTKESWDVSGVYLFIYLSIYFIFIFSFIFFVRVSLECKDVED